ncbi:SAM-dependent methyltransferase [Sphingomonas cavernae]|uniref:Class I SAM-dependent methyltransferase n=1 Tax=Sphingomonas cavernae TaxID=2320861 RepID=A0A418WPB9_9SPHN|nr:cyclopropane-fatty-acyl-phospholipid synthase family protein [Sphingomonas cavernae]RJF93070.1 class I SAM-dependent methyltransferase [Sphingomonas cavernae]
MNVQLPEGRHQFARAAGAKALGSGWLASVYARGFHHLLDRIDAGLDEGAIEARLPDGSRRVLGGRGAGPTAEVDLRSWTALLRLARSGSVGWYDAWVRGEWRSSDPVPLFDLFMRNRAGLGNSGRASGVFRALVKLQHWLRRNSRAGARRNIEFHYDLGNDFYALWLDASMTYSSALFAEPIAAVESLEKAQARKIETLLGRLGLKRGDSLIEIGSGWGGLAEAAARDHGASVTGITLSPSQKLYAEQRLAAAGLDGRVRFELVDYRDATGQYDALASVEMVEAVGQEYWEDYLAAIHRLLKPGGRAAIQYILIADDIFEGYAASADFIQTYIFPGGMLLSESRFRAIAERLGLEWRDRESFGLDYAETLRRWRQNFDAAVTDGRLPSEFDEHFVNLWRYYLMYCEGGFRGQGIDVAQVTLVKPR